METRWWRRWWVIGIVVLLAAGTGVGLWLGTGSSGGDYTTSAASIGSVTQNVSATGTLEAVNQADAAFTVGGQVSSVSVAVGQQVTAGETLAQLETASLQTTVDQDTDTVDADEAKLATDESASSGATASGGSQDSSESQIDQDEAQLDADQSQLESAEANLAAATLTAPIAGTVVAVNLAVGDTVGASSSTADIEIQDLSSFEVTASVSTADVDLVKEGDRAVVTSASSPAGVAGTVTSVALVPTVSNGVATFPVVVSVDGDPSGLYSGVSADVSIVAVRAARVLTVPTSAVHYSGASTFVDVLSRGREVPRSVTVGATGSALTQILSGLHPGERVVLADLSAALPDTTSNGAVTRGPVKTFSPIGGGAVHVQEGPGG